ncbi:MAG: phosphatase PAP2 family protein [Clostridia bacterium]|nr:phosphatase PAP2 family protein [Clostridia bacterium]
MIGLVIATVLQTVVFFTVGNLSDNAHVVWCGMDDYIPFVPVFAIPYVLWFGYIAVGLISFWLFRRRSERDHREFVRTMWVLGLGLIYCTIFYIIVPTRIPYAAKPVVADDGKFLSWLLEVVYGNNVANNALPSEHCYVSMALCLGFWRAPALMASKHRFWVLPACTLLSLSICAATVLIKQHSILDFFASLMLFVVICLIVYRIPWGRTNSKEQPAK